MNWPSGLLLSPSPSGHRTNATMTPITHAKMDCSFPIARQIQINPIKISNSDLLQRPRPILDARLSSNKNTWKIRCHSAEDKQQLTTDYWLWAPQLLSLNSPIRVMRTLAWLLGLLGGVEESAFTSSVVGMPHGFQADLIRCLPGNSISTDGKDQLHEEVLWIRLKSCRLDCWQGHTPLS